MTKAEARALIKTHAGNLFTAMQELSADELKNIIEVAENYSATNCWYGEFYMKDSVLKFARNRLDYIQETSKVKP